MNQLLQIIVSAGATAGTQAFLQIALKLKLEPMAHWNWPDSVVEMAPFVVVVVGAIVASASDREAKKIFSLMIAVVVMLVSLGGYTFLANTPPSQGSLVIYDVFAYIFFFLTYFAYGFAVAHVVNFLLASGGFVTGTGTGTGAGRRKGKSKGIGKDIGKDIGKGPGKGTSSGSSPDDSGA